MKREPLACFRNCLPGWADITYVASKPLSDSLTTITTCVAVIGVAILVAGCGTTFKERHFFQTISGSSGRATNYFRLTVEGDAKFSSARYIAGFYDERAVDLYFNELKPGQPGGNIAPLFPADQKNPGDNTTIVPLKPDDTKGAFVMVFSTDAKAVVDTIGSFAENQVTADALSNLVNRADIRASNEANARIATDIRRASATLTVLNGLFAQLADPNASLIQTQEAELRILNAIGAALGYETSFKTSAEAAAWMATARAARRGD
jgi:hypothetical protein